MMRDMKRLRRKKYFTVAEANAMLPLLRSILRDVMELASQLRDRGERLRQLQLDNTSSLGDFYKEEIEQIQANFEQEQLQMEEYEQELHELGVELKDYSLGLVDFPSILDHREIYLCWRIGEPEVRHWHEIDAGFAGRQRILEDLAHT